MARSLAALLLLLLSSTLSAMTLSRQQTIRRADGSKAAIRLDNFTRLVLYTEREGDDKSYSRAIQEGLARMGTMHCAIVAIQAAIREGSRREGAKFGPAKAKFGNPRDEHGEYDSGTQSITLNMNKAYLFDLENMARGLYHEGLHHAECSLGLRQPGEMATYHDPKRIPVILGKLLGENAPCLKLVREDGALLNEDGSLYDKDYGVGEPAGPTAAPPQLDQVPPRPRVLRLPKTLEFDGK